MKKAVVTVLGLDKVGITAKVCTVLADTNINILDISQTIVGGYFNMVMVVDITEAKDAFAEAAEKLQAVGEEMGLEIKIQHTDIFDAMHRI
ncbi:MAG: ACT domain-containing protein [Anaerotignum sp.]|jgi:ACT domain-containing protein|nr:ACT domain-containing protein [Anaerotignum sp.]MBR6541682.1 ACT domain-containing protein [Anaerotignum sp.]